MCKVSIIIPIYNAQKSIQKLLKIISNQSFDKSLFEVLLIDNNSEDESASIIKSFITNHKADYMKYYFYDEEQSSYAARNHAIALAKGDILAFTDADCILDKDWLLNINQSFIDYPSVDIVSGHIHLYIQDEKNIFEFYDKTIHMRNDIKYKSKEAATANLAVRKEVFSRVGLFEEIKSGGDFLWMKRANKADINMKYVKEIYIYHPARNSYYDMKNKMLRIAYGNGQIYKIEGKSYLIGQLINALRILNLPQVYKVSRIVMKNVGLFGTIRLNYHIVIIRILQTITFHKGYKGK